MASDLLHALLAASLVAGAVILLLCAIRVPLRRAFGARIAYLTWAALPAAMLTMATAALTALRLPAPVLQAVAPPRQLAGAGLPVAGIVDTPWQQWQPWLAAGWPAPWQRRHGTASPTCATAASLARCDATAACITARGPTKARRWSACGGLSW